MFKKIQDEVTKKGFSVWEMFKDGFISGLGWSFGVTVGFVIISTIVIQILKSLGGLPLVGDFMANIVQATQQQLILKGAAK